MPASNASVIGRYAIYEEIAAGGMATVHYGRLVGPVGFSRPVAIKRLHPHLSRDPQFVTMFLDEARLAARVRHPNVVATIDIVSTDNQLFLVMEYVEGESLSRLVRRASERGERMPIGVTASIMAGALHGLHAAHEATNERGEPLGIVHRDVSPQNIIVGLDGVARVLDFGVAKAVGRLHETREGQLKGKLAYIAPELVSNGPVTRAVDVYAASVVLWEALTGDRLFHDTNEAAILAKILQTEVDPPSKLNPEVPKAIDELVLRGLQRDPKKRWPTAREMARAIEAAVPVATASSVGEWVESLAKDALDARARKVAEIESHSDLFDRSGMLERPITSSQKTSAVPHFIDATELSSTHLTTEVYSPFPEEKPRSRKALFVLGSIGLAILVGGIGFYLSTRTAVVPVPAAPVTTETAIASTPSTSTSTSTSTSASASTGTLGSASGSASTPTPSASPRPTIKRPPAIKAGCNPPYTVDAQGIKKYKVECL